MIRIIASLSMLIAAASGGLVSAQTTVLDDFTTLTVVNHPPAGVGTAGVYYDLAHNSFAVPSFVSDTLQMDDGGFGNGVYAEMTTTVPTTADYTVQMDLLEIVEDAANLNGIRNIQIGVWLNATHRPENPGNFVDQAAGGNGAPDAVGSTTVVFDATDNSVSGTPFETISTGVFSATAGDSIFIAIATDVEGTDATGAGGGSGNSGTWGTSFYRVDNLVLVEETTLGVESWEIYE